MTYSIELFFLSVPTSIIPLMDRLAKNIIPIWQAGKAGQKVRPCTEVKPEPRLQCPYPTSSPESHWFCVSNHLQERSPHFHSQHKSTPGLILGKMPANLVSENWLFFQQSSPSLLSRGLHPFLRRTWSQWSPKRNQLKRDTNTALRNPCLESQEVPGLHFQEGSVQPGFEWNA